MLMSAVCLPGAKGGDLLCACASCSKSVPVLWGLSYTVHCMLWLLQKEFIRECVFKQKCEEVCFLRKCKRKQRWSGRDNDWRYGSKGLRPVDGPTETEAWTTLAGLCPEDSSCWSRGIGGKKELGRKRGRSKGWQEKKDYTDVITLCFAKTRKLRLGRERGEMLGYLELGKGGGRVIPKY